MSNRKIFYVSTICVENECNSLLGFYRQNFFDFEIVVVVCSLHYVGKKRLEPFTVGFFLSFKSTP